MNDLISIVIPVYNVQDYLAACLKSVVSQSYKNLQIILVNDGSTDDSLKICESFAADDSRIQIISQKNGGLSEARNTGMREAEGDWLCFVDSDDWIEADTVETLLTHARDHKVSLVQGGVVKEYKDHTDVYKSVDSVIQLDRVQAAGDLVDYRFDPKKTLLMNAVWAKLYRKDLFDQIRFPKGRIFEDISVQGELVKRAGTVVVVPGLHYHWTQDREGRLSTTRPLSFYTDAWLAFKDRYDQFAHDDRYASIYRKLVVSTLFSVEKYWRITRSHPYEEVMRHKKAFYDMSAFVRGHFKYLKDFSGKKRVVLLMACLPAISLRAIRIRL